MSENLVLAAVYMIFAKCQDKAQLEIFYNHIKSFEKNLDNVNVLEEGFRQSEIALFKQSADGTYSKVLAIKTRRERTGEALTDVVASAKALFAKKGWDW